MNIKDIIYAQIAGGGGGEPIVLQDKTVTPTTQQQVIEADDGYTALDTVTVEGVTAAIDQNIVAGNIKDGITILGVQGTVVPSDFDLNSFMAGTMKDVVMGAPTLRNYAFYQYTNLETFTDTNLTTLGLYAFNGCTNLKSFVGSSSLTEISAYCFQNCSNLENIDLTNVNIVRNSAFNGCAKLKLPSVFECSTVEPGAFQTAGNKLDNTYSSTFYPNATTSIGASAFYNANIKEIRGSFGDVGQNAFNQLRYSNNQYALVLIDCTINGSVGDSAFGYNQKVEYIDIHNSNITSITGAVFRQLGNQRNSPSTNILTIDLRNSTFTSINSYMFNDLVYTDIRLPSTLNTLISSSIFTSANHVNIFFADSTPPTLQNTGTFGGTYSIFVPYQRVVEYQSATNWSTSTIQNNLKGYAPENTFTAGEALPEYTKQGHAITWYSDKDLTTVVTTCPVGSPELYCIVATTQTKQVVTIQYKGIGMLSVLDSNNNPVDISLGYFLGSSGDTFTLTAGSSEQDSTIILKVDDVVEISPYTLTLGSSDVSVFVNAYPNSLNLDFDTATWAEIKAAVDYDQFDAYTPYLGHSKSVTLTTNEVVEFMLVDTTGQCYEYADGSGYAGLIFVTKNCLASQYKLYNTDNNSGGYNASLMATSIIPAFIDTLPSDVASVISEVKIVRDSGYNGTTLTTGNSKGFLMAEKEVFTTRHSSFAYEFDALKTFEYYQTHATDADRIRYRLNSATVYWLSSSTSSYYASCVVAVLGSYSTQRCGNVNGIAPCIAI